MNRFAQGDERVATLATLERLRRGGIDLSQPMAIDFHVAASALGTAEAIALAAAAVGFDCRVVDEGDGEFTVWCTTNLKLTVNSIAAVEDQLDAIAQPLGGFSDGWGLVGRRPGPA